MKEKFFVEVLEMVVFYALEFYTGVNFSIEHFESEKKGGKFRHSVFLLVHFFPSSLSAPYPMLIFSPFFFFSLLFPLVQFTTDAKHPEDDAVAICAENSDDPLACEMVPAGKESGSVKITVPFELAGKVRRKRKE